MDKKERRAPKVITLTIYIVCFLMNVAIATALVVVWGLTRLSDLFLVFLYFPFLLVSLIVPGLILVFGHFYNEKHNVLQKKTRIKYYQTLIGVIIIGTLSSVIPIEIKHQKLRTYSREEWLRAAPYYRGMMFDSFEEQVNLVGEKETTVIYYLGNPNFIPDDQNAENISSYYYDLGLYHDYLDPTYYIVTFDSAMTVIATSTT